MCKIQRDWHISSLLKQSYLYYYSSSYKLSGTQNHQVKSNSLVHTVMCSADYCAVSLNITTCQTISSLCSLQNSTHCTHLVLSLQSHLWCVMFMRNFQIFHDHQKFLRICKYQQHLTGKGWNTPLTTDSALHADCTRSISWCHCHLLRPVHP